MTREDIATKAARYLAEGRLIITRVDGDHITATCRGSGAVHSCGHDPDRGDWWCDCPARRTCAHLVALQRVTIRRPA